MESLFKLSSALVLTFCSGMPYAQGSDAPPTAPAQFAIDGVIQEADSWRLPEGYFVSAKMPMTIVHPRSFRTEDGGDETSEFARHKHAYPGIEYRIPISIQGGAYPFYYEVLEGPSGMSIGQQYGDPNYGELYWTPVNQNGSHLVRILITDQDLTQRVAEWTISVGTEQFVFVDSGAEPGGDGTISSPLNKFSDLHGGVYPGNGALGNEGTDAFAGKIAYLRGGTYEVADIPTPWLSFTASSPRVILGYPGESADVDTTNGQMRVSVPDFFIGNVIVRHAPDLNLLPATHWSEVPGRTSGASTTLYATDNSWNTPNASRAIQVGATADRVTLFQLLAKEGQYIEKRSFVHPSLGAAGNNAVIHGGAVGNTSYRSYMTLWDIKIQDLNVSFANLYTSWYGVAEGIVALPDSGGPFKMSPLSRLLFLKSQNSFWSIRRCRWTESPLTRTGGANLNLMMSNRHVTSQPLFIEAAYNVVHSKGDLAGNVLNYNAGHDGKADVDGNNIWVYRNTFIGRLRGNDRPYTITLENNVMMIHTWEFPEGAYPESGEKREVVVSGPDLIDVPSAWSKYMDNDYRLKGQFREEWLGIVGHEIYGFGLGGSAVAD